MGAGSRAGHPPLVDVRWLCYLLFNNVLRLNLVVECTSMFSEVLGL